MFWFPFPLHDVKSFIWQLAKKVNSKIARCILYNQDIVYCGNTTNLYQHLKDKHLMQYNKTKMEAAKREWSSELHSSQSQQDMEFDIDEPNDSEVIESAAEVQVQDQDQVLRPRICSNIFFVKI